MILGHFRSHSYSKRDLMHDIEIAYVWPLCKYPLMWEHQKWDQIVPVIGLECRVRET